MFAVLVIEINDQSHQIRGGSGEEKGQNRTQRPVKSRI